MSYDGDIACRNYFYSTRFVNLRWQYFEELFVQKSFVVTKHDLTFLRAGIIRAGITRTSFSASRTIQIPSRAMKCCFFVYVDPPWARDASFFPFHFDYIAFSIIYLIVGNTHLYFVYAQFSRRHNVVRVFSLDRKTTNTVPFCFLSHATYTRFVNVYLIGAGWNTGASCICVMVAVAWQEWMSTKIRYFFY